MEVRQVNNAQSLSINLSVDVKFLFAGQFRTKAIPDQGERYYVAPTPCMGNYLDVAVTQLYDTVYDRTKEYIDEFFKRYPKDPVFTPAGVFGDESEAGTSKTDRATLKYLFRTIEESKVPERQGGPDIHYRHDTEKRGRGAVPVFVHQGSDNGRRFIVFSNLFEGVYVHE
ncbi:hypothetical protein J6590_055920 [Homalodisca vitripennis]|nr:hypothetical protein J6590_055920 [Homalodisca vitripennis]